MAGFIETFWQRLQQQLQTGFNASNTNLLRPAIELTEVSGGAINPRVRKPNEDEDSGRSSAYNRLKLVLMHDRTQLEPHVLEQMRDDMVAVISKYVQIDQNSIELNLDTDPETNTIALVANIPVMRNVRLATPSSEIEATETPAQPPVVASEVQPAGLTPAVVTQPNPENQTQSIPTNQTEPSSDKPQAQPSGKKSAQKGSTPPVVSIQPVATSSADSTTQAPETISSL